MDSPDARILLAARCLRMFSYGSIAVVLYLFLMAQFSPLQMSAILTCIMVGDFVMSLVLSSRADRTWGRRNTLLVGTALKAIAGVGFALFPDSFVALAVCGTIGVITPTGGEIGPFLSVEQAALAELDAHNTLHNLSYIMAWYQAIGGIAAALGAFTAGQAVRLAPTYLPVGEGALATLNAYRALFALYAAVAAFMFLLYSCLSPRIEHQEEAEEGKENASAPHDDCCSPVADEPPPLSGTSYLLRHVFGLRSVEYHSVVLTISALFCLDAFAGALVLQSYLSLWFHDRWGLSEASLGTMLMFVNVIGGISGFVSSWLVRRIGAIATMVFTHLPSNVLLCLIPLMPSQVTALGMLFARFSISQMDVPARQAYVTTVVPSAERSAVNGITNAARTVGVSFAPLLLPYFLASSQLMSLPFVVAAVLKIIYDLTLYYQFRNAEKAGARDTTEKEEETETDELITVPTTTAHKTGYGST